MNRRLGTLGLIAAMVFSVSAHAQDEAAASDGGAAASEGGSAGAKASLAKNLYFSPMINYVKAADSRGTDDGYGASFAIGKSMTSGLNLELTGFANFMDARGQNNGGDTKLYGLGITAMVFPSSILPDLYVPISLMRGQVRKMPGPVQDYSTTFFDIGLGYLIPVGFLQNSFPGAAWRAEAKYRIDAHGRENAGTTPGENQNFYEGAFGVGLLLPLGAKAAPAPEPEAPPAETPAETAVVPVAAGDADNDGVPDDADQCPETPAGAIVDEKGCERDSDGDGVVDRLDKCPDTPAGTAVNEEGCPAAPPPPACQAPSAGEPIDLNGCKAGDSVVLKGVNFEVDSARLTPNAKTILDSVADALLAQQGMSAEIGGHTSSEGSTEHNQRLSQRRADSVKTYLVLSRGLDSGRLTTKGYGEGSPVADNNTEAGRELNRRVELKVMGGGAAEPAASEGAAPAALVAPAEAPAEAAPAESTPAEAAPAEGQAAPAEAAPAEAAPAEGEAAPAEAAPAEAAPAEGEAAPAEQAPEVEGAQP